MKLAFRKSRTSGRRKILSACAAGLTIPVSMLSGCGVSVPPQMGAVTVTDVKGNPQSSITTLQHGASIYFDVTVLHDAEYLGADWTVTCSSSLPEGSLPPGMVDTSCGTFAPYHTISGPVPTYPGVTGIVTQYTAPASIPAQKTVTIVVHATSLPSSTATLVLTIN